MSRRTISETEIALIKGMLSRGMKNKDIQFFFNRPERPVNTGRISTIGTGAYSNSREIPTASESELDKFIQSFPAYEHGVKVTAIHSRRDSSAEERAKALFKKNAEDEWILINGETEECECKLDFDPKRMTPVVRAVAGLANNKGGFIFFGVSNSRFKAEGIGDGFSKTDIVRIVDRVKAHLSPTPVIEAKGIIELDDRSIGFLYVARHTNPPVIVYRDGDNLSEGDILFRYPGQSSRIKFGDLRFLLEERDRRSQLALVGVAGKIAEKGADNVLILDTDKNVLEAKGHSLLIDQQLAETLKFIKEGQFDERVGAPALKLIGEVAPVSIKGAVTSKIAHAAIFQENILDTFLEQKRVDNPIQYIYAGLAQSRLWLPIFYFARLSGNSNEEVVDLVKGLKVSQKGKKSFLVERLLGRRSAFTKSVTQASARVRDEITAGTLSVPESIEDAAVFSQGLTAVSNTPVESKKLLAVLQKCRDLAEASDHGSARGAIFKAACRLDEIFFR